MKLYIYIIIIILITPIVIAVTDCERITTIGKLPCSLRSSWGFNCTTVQIKIYNNEPKLLRIAQPSEYGSTGRCNITFGIQDNETEIGSYLFNWSNGDSSSIIVQEDDEMLISLVIGISLIVALFVFLTFATKEEKPFLANFFFLGIFIFTTVLCNLIWKMTNVNASPYEPVMLIVYRIFLIITMLMIFIVLVMVTIDAVQLRKWIGNPVDNYRDNLDNKQMK